ncbi:MAG: bifunctional UDP-sugar hydrolase/5'-nucleotidase [Vampirovibrionia bacterium]
MKYKFKLCTLIFVCLFVYTFFQGLLFAKDFELRVLHTNDVHGRLIPFKLGISDYDKEVGGLAGRYTLIKNARKASANVLVLDAGDIMQGTLFFKTHKGKPDIQFMNELGYDAAAIGNHEFDNGCLALAERISEAKFPFLSANLVFDKKTNLNDKVKPYVIKDINGLKVGIIGLTTPDVVSISVIGEKAKVYKTAKIVQKYIDKIDPETDVIIILSHLGVNKDEKLVKEISGADLIVGGHTHTLLDEPVILTDKKKEKIIVLQSGEFGEHIGDLKLNVHDDKVELVSYKMHSIDHSVSQDKVVAEQLEPFKKELDAAKTDIIANTTTNINVIRDQVRSQETSGGNFIVDAIKYVYPAVDIALQQGGGIRSDRIIPPGGLTFLDIVEMTPFDSKIEIFDIKGKDLKLSLERAVSKLPFSSSAFLQVSGLTFIADLSKQPQEMSSDYKKIVKKGKRIKSVMVNGQPLDEDKVYKVAAIDFLVNGGDAHISLRDGASNIERTGVSLTNVLKQYLTAKKTVAPIVDDRIKIINIPKE